MDIDCLLTKYKDVYTIEKLNKHIANLDTLYMAKSDDNMTTIIIEINEKTH